MSKVTRMPPGGSCCSVACCSNYSKKGKRSEAQEKLIFHTFPCDTKLRKEWIRRCYRKGNFIPLRICSKHFKPSDYEDEMQGRLMGFVPRKLKKDAIPTLHLRPQTPPRSPKKDSRTVRYQARRNKLVVESLIEEPRSEEVEEPLTNDEVENIDFNESSQQRVTKLEEENKALKEKIKEYESNELSLKEKLDEMQLRLEKATQNISDQAQILFKDFLSPNQAKLALKKLSKVRWTQEDLSRAFTIRYLSKRCYQYLRNTLHYPLPGLSTLHRWAANINLRTGHLNQIINIMAITRQTKGPLWGMTMLAFDEVKICSMYEFDQAADEIVGPHQYMQVVMARGIIENWKQPVYIAFDQKITKEILFEIIEKLHDAKYDVVGIVSDCGGSNMGLWKELSITTEKTSFTHPKSTRNIYVFADVPHLLKLVRNWFLDKGFVLKSGKVINKSPVEELICGTGTEISSLFKLTAAHINCVGTQRQNVALAAQLFSRSTATALKRYLPGSDAALARDVGDFIQLINDWFDIMNSYSKYPNVPTKEPYGLNLEYQNNILKEMVQTIEGMLCKGKTTLQIFQKGIIISSKSLQALYTSLKETTTVKYLLTHRLNQDCLENFFSQIRTRGGLHDHPSPLNALHRIRVILLGKNPGLVQAHANVTVSGEEEGVQMEEYLLATAFKKAKLLKLNIPANEPSLNLGPEGDVDVSDTASVQSTSSTSTSTSSVNESECPISEKDGFNYLAGYIAKKYLKEYPYLGRYTKDMEPITFHNYSFPTWVQSLSFGGLIEPSRKWLSEFELLNKYFQKIHKHKFKFFKNINTETVSYISRKVSEFDIPAPLIKAFVRQRIFIRIKYLNQKCLRQASKRKSTSAADHKSVKKMKKILN